MNVREVVEQYTRAAQGGNINAMNVLGNLYYNGEVVDRNYRLAFKWYKAAAEGVIEQATCPVLVVKSGGDD